MLLVKMTGLILFNTTDKVILTSYRSTPVETTRPTEGAHTSLSGPTVKDTHAANHAPTAVAGQRPSPRPGIR